MPHSPPLAGGLLTLRVAAPRAGASKPRYETLASSPTVETQSESRAGSTRPGLGSICLSAAPGRLPPAWTASQWCLCRPFQVPWHPRPTSCDPWPWPDPLHSISQDESQKLRGLCAESGKLTSCSPAIGGFQAPAGLEYLLGTLRARQLSGA